MEVLNQNQRKRVLWRLFLFGILTLAIVTAIVVSIHENYSRLGEYPLKECKNKYEKDRRVWLGNNQRLKNEKRKLEKRIKTLKDEKKVPNEIEHIYEARIKQKDDRIRGLESDLTRCQSQSNTPSGS